MKIDWKKDKNKYSIIRGCGVKLLISKEKKKSKQSLEDKGIWKLEKINCKRKQQFE